MKLLGSSFVAWSAATAEPVVVNVWPGKVPEENCNIGPERSLLALAIFSSDHQIDGVEALVAFVLSIALGTFTVEKIPRLRRPFLGRDCLEGAAIDGAYRAFRTFGVGDTSGRTGLLIYVSLFERSVVGLGDTAIAGALSREDYAAIRDVLIDGLAQGRVEAALIAAIRKAGDILAGKLPRAADDMPEITNALRILD